MGICALGRIRTLNPQSRNLIFYPVELRVLKTKESFLSQMIYEIASFTFAAASAKVMAEETLRPDSSMILAPSSALVP